MSEEKTNNYEIKYPEILDVIRKLDVRQHNDDSFDRFSAYREIEEIVENKLINKK